MIGFSIHFRSLRWYSPIYSFYIYTANNTTLITKKEDSFMLVRWHRLLVLFLAARRPGPWSAKPNCESDGSSAARGSTWGSRRCTWRVGRSERSCGYWGRWKTARRLAPWAIREPRPSVAALPYRERDHNFHEYRWFTWISMISRKNGYHLQFRWGIQKWSSLLSV